MGNCLICHKKNNKIASLSPQDDLDRLFEEARKAAADDAANKEKVVRVRVLVTKQELMEILNRDREESNSNLDLSNTSSSLALEELVMRKVKLREFHEIFNDDEAVANCGWKPALESIPEDS
ncbi:hypothetical protein LINGRAHAP2_LOCUS18852 [Linum grandiflorum]